MNKKLSLFLSQQKI